MPTADETPDRLGRYWNAVVRRAVASDDGLHPTLTETIRRLHAGDDAPAPDPAFLRRLEEDLMHPVPAVRPRLGRPSLNLPGATPIPNLRPRGKDDRLPPVADSQRRSPLTWAATAAILLLTLASGYAAYRLAPPSSGDDVTTLPGAQGAPLPTAAESTPVPGECRVAPGSLDRITLTGAATTTDVVPLRPGPYEGQPVGTDATLPLAGRPADPDTVAGVTSVIRELVACLNEDDVARVVALFSDDYWRRLNGVEFRVGTAPDPGDPTTLVPLVGVPTGPLPAPTVEDVRVLADGRVAAVLRPGSGTHPPFFNYYVFARLGGGWLIDEAVGDAEYDVVEVVVRDDGFEPAEIRLPELTWPKIVIRNEGTVPHSFVLPDAGIRIEVAPGETREEEIGGQLGGSSPFFSDIPGDREAGLVGMLVVAEGSAATPEPSPVNTEAWGPSGPALASAAIAARPPGVFAPESLAILADRDVSLSLRNDGDGGPANFTIDPLGISVDIPQGETKAVVINAPAGVYAFYSAIPGHAGAGMFGTLFVVDEATPTPS